VKRNTKRNISVVLSGVLCLLSILGTFTYTEIAYAYAAKQGNVIASTLNVRERADKTSAKVASLSRGTKVVVVDESAAGAETWYKIQFSTASGTREGYVLKTYINAPSDEQLNYTADANFEKMLNEQGFPETYKKSLRVLHAKYPKWVFKAQKTGIDWEEVISNQSIVGRNLVHRNSQTSWKSTQAGAYNRETGTWVGFDTNAWVSASEGIIRYYMDPRNFLDEFYIFQFLDNSYSANGHERSGLENLVKGSFLAGKENISSQSSANAPTSQSPGSGSAPTSQSPGSGSAGGSVVGTNAPSRGKSSGVSLSAPGSGQENSVIYQAAENSAIGPGAGLNQASPTESPTNTPEQNAPAQSTGTGGDGSYVDIIMKAGKESGVNPYVLAAMIIQEQGVNGTSGLINGNTAPYQGHYNFFNIEAYQKGSQSPVQRGLWWASQEGSYGRPWNSREKAIIGGAKYYGDNYVKASQNTLYLKKFNVMGTNRYKHQYMTNIEGAAHEGVKLSNAYTQELKNSVLEFCIPVYNNMPELPESMPSGNSVSTNNNTTQAPSQDVNTTNSPTGTNSTGNGSSGSTQTVGPGAVSNNNTSKKTESRVSLVAP